MFDKLANIFRIPDLRKRILFTLGLLFVYRLGGHLPTPGVKRPSWNSSSSSTADRSWDSSICSPAASCAG